MLYVIHAYEQRYGGYHGFEDWSIEDCNNVDEAVSIARENSLEVINSYSCIYEELEEEVEEEIEEVISQDRAISEEDIELLRADIYKEDIDYNIYIVDKDIVKEFDIEVLEQMLNKDPEYFIENFTEIL